MKQNLGPKAAIFPMPVLMIGTYDENGKVDVMNAAWGMECGSNMLALCLTSTHKTSKNLRVSKACTVALADLPHMKEADFFGIASGNTMEDKFERTGLTAVKSERVNAPVIEEFPLTMECELLEERQVPEGSIVTGRILNVNADEKVLDENGKVVAGKLNAVIFDQFGMSYYKAGEQFAKAWNAGAELAKE